MQAEYERLLKKELFGSAENPTGPLTDAQKETASRFYDLFRQKILAAAVERNNAEGQQYITGERNVQRGWSYYNSDYYYASESAISAITAGAQAVAQEHDSTFTVPDYLAKGETHRYNFNSALAGDPFIVSENHFVLDPDVVPPKHFQWFFESGGNATAQGSIQLTSMTVSNADGTKTVTDYTTDGFDPTNSCKGRTWVCWTDESGTEHRQEAEFRLDAQGKPRKVSDLLSPSKQDTESASLLNRFLANLQCYAKGYFERFAVLSPNLDLRI